MRNNRYLIDRMMRRSRDGRNPYGSKGGYVRDSNEGNSYDYYKERYDSRDYDYSNDYNDYHDADQRYHKDLRKVRERLKRKDKFNLPDNDVLQKAKQMGITFDEYEEDEFLFAYNLMMSEFADIVNEPNKFIHMAKQWLEDDNIKVSPNEKVAITLYEMFLPNDSRRHY